jgi:hypothetical protein
MSGSIWYVSPTGADAGGTAGRQRTAPLLTIAQAITNASAGDAIQVLAGSYSISASLAASKAGLRFLGEGSGETTRPQITISTANPAFALSAAGIWIENFTFKTPTASGGSHVALTAASCKLVDCLFEASGNVTSQCVNLGAGTSNTELIGCQFRGQGASASARPAVGLTIANAISDVMLDTVTFDGGTYGWSGYALTASAAVTRLTGIDCDFLNDSDLQVATGSVYQFHRRLTSGSARMEFAA